VLGVDDESVLSFVTFKPCGAVGRIAAFSHPFLFALNGIVMALLAGNAIVVKPS
jgi:acyl-CoA reductase-like NAD-dependent aldehyde dehydrogenase